MAGRKREKIAESDLAGFKHFKKIAELLKSVVHNAACDRDRAHNRTLHMDQYMLLLVLYMMNPICVSLRALEQASELKKVQRLLGVPRCSLGSLSEAARVFDADLMKEVIKELVGELGPMQHDPRLDDVKAIITLVDGTLIPALAGMGWARYQKDHNAVRAHFQVELLKCVPVAASVTAANDSERDELVESLQGGRLYVHDRGYASFQVMQKVIDARSSFVGRLNDDTVFRVVQERELSQEALKAGIVRDAVVWLGVENRPNSLRQPVRIVQVKCTPHVKRYKIGRGGPPQGETLLIVTDRMDLPPEVIALIYQYRWAIEIFFRTFKHLLGCRHLLSTCENGIELQMYAAILACLLIALYTGRRPTQRTYEMLNYHFMGWADQDELEAHIRSLKPQA